MMWRFARHVRIEGEQVGLSSEKTRVGLWLFVVFFLSGMSALVYQLAWQRFFFAMFGIDIVSVTLIVTGFMLGLGIGGLAGGLLSRVVPGRALLLFAGFELGIGCFGFLSLDLFQWAAALTFGMGHFAIACAAFLLVVFPTTLMGATLPLLVSHTTHQVGNVGRSVGNLYLVNTLGAAAGCFVTVGWMFGDLGLQASIQLTAWLNTGLGLTIWMFARKRAPHG